MAVFNVLAMLGLLLIKMASASTSFSMPVESVPAIGTVTTVTTVTSTTIVEGTQTVTSVVSSLSINTLFTVQTSTPTAIPTIPLVTTSHVHGSYSDVVTIQTSTTPANAMNSTVVVIQTSTVASGNGTSPIGMTSTAPATSEASGYQGPSTVVVTRTQSHNTGTMPNSTAKMTTSATESPNLVNAAAKVDGCFFLGAVVAVGVFYFA
ncbi:hypothetical protein N0V83_009061 [Neocucurbitaria cava]|uniref:Uncharacterized protein n=1 Tax=Neocucurbitaria cava TaxID=798079 RepID=A0A9W8Y0U4_9PLEO|nr:hypothetical protein N0V83_009061 [Neocucurbitaria cava]